MSPAAPDATEPPAPDERLHSLQAFRRFAARVTPWAYRWLGRLRVAERDRDDVLQETLIAAYRRRDAYDPTRGTWEGWAFGFLSMVVRNYRKRTARRVKRVDVARVDLPDVAVDGPGPDEETDEIMMRRLLARCMGGIDEDSRAILLARAEGISIVDIAAALGVSESTAYVYYNEARAEVQRALEREQQRKRALGLAVLPISLDQVLASEGPPPDVPAATMRRVWQGLDRAMAPDIEAGRLADDGTDAPRYLGSPGTAPRSRALRAFEDPRVSHALTAVAGALGGALITLQTMSGLPARRDTEPQGVANAVAAGSPAPGLSASEASDGNRPRGSAEDAVAPEPAPPGAAAPARTAEDGEQALIDRALAAYQHRLYGKAITAFAEHAQRYPRGQFAGSRERLLTLALIGAGRRDEARRRIESIRQTDPRSQALAELDAALSAAPAAR